MPTIDQMIGHITQHDPYEDARTEFYRLKNEEKSLREFIKQGWDVVEKKHQFVDGWHIGAICEHLEAVYRGEIENLLINVPHG